MADRRGWVAFGLDGCLTNIGTVDTIGDPNEWALAQLKEWLELGLEVRIFTARVGGDWSEERDRQYRIVEDWCLKNIGQVLPVTCKTDWGMQFLYDDRCIQLDAITGLPIAGELLRIATERLQALEACEARCKELEEENERMRRTQIRSEGARSDD